MQTTATQKPVSLSSERDSILRAQEREVEDSLAPTALCGVDAQRYAISQEGNIQEAVVRPAQQLPAGRHTFINVPAGTAQPLMLQPKLRVSKPGDRYEEEADAIAETLMRQPAKPMPGLKVQPLLPSPPTAAVTVKPNVATGIHESAVRGVVSSAGKTLDDATRSFMERRFGYDFSGVRIHDDASAHHCARALNALAYTHRQHIIFAEGQYQPNTGEGRALLAHELVHALQQGVGQPLRSDSETIEDFIEPLPETATTFQRDQEVEIRQQPAAENIAGKPTLNPLSIQIQAPESMLLLKGVPDIVSGVISAQPSSLKPAPKAKDAPPQKADRKATDTGKKASAAENVLKGAAKPDTKPAGGGSPAPKKETPKEERPKVQLDTTDSGTLLQSISETSPTNFIQASGDVGPSVAALHQKEKADLVKSLPQIEQPTGLPVRGSAGAEKKKAALQKGKAPDLKTSGNGGRVAKAPEKPAPIPEKARTANVPTPHALASGEKPDPAFKEMFRYRITQLPVQDDAVSTSAGPRPEIDLKDDADLSQNDTNMSLASNEVVSSGTAADEAISQDFGEGDIYPEVATEMMRPTLNASQVPGGSGAVQQGLPDAPEALYAGFDEQMSAGLSEQIQPELEKNDAEMSKMETDSAKERQDNQDKIDKETDRVRNEQEAAQKGARAEVDAQREDWKKENDKVRSDYSTGADDQRAECDGRIQDKTDETNRDVEAKYAEAEEKAGAEKEKTEREAEAKKRKAEAEAQEGSSLWDSIVDAVSDFFDALKDALNSLFDALRQLVKDIIDVAKKVVNTLIDLARDAIVGFIKALGEVLKTLVNIALSAFPEIAERINALIDRAVDAAVDVVNKLAEGLKKAVAALLDALGAVLDALLAAYQAFYNALIDALKFIAVGLIKILRGIANLIQAAVESPGHFWAQVSVELIGQDITNPLPNEVGYDKAADETQIGNGFETMDHLKSLAGIKSDEDETLPAGKDELSTEDIVNPEIVEGLALSPELQAQVASLPEEGTVEFGHSPENEGPVLGPVAEKNNTELTASATTSVPEMGSPVSAGQKVGPFKNAWERGQYVLGQIKDGISQWWSKNSGKVIAGLVAALVAGVVLEVVTGGAITAAIPVLLEIIAALFAVQDVVDAGVFVGQYLTKSFVGQIAAGAMSLARAFVKLVIALAFDLIGGGELMKGIKGGVKAAEEGGVKGVVAFGKSAAKNAIAKQAKNLSKLGKIAKSGYKAAVENGKVILRGIRGGIKGGSKTLEELAHGLLSRFRFKRFKFVRQKLRFFLFGEINPWVLLASGEIKHVDLAEMKGLKVGDDLVHQGEKAILIGVRDSDDASKLVKRLNTPAAKQEAEDLFEKLKGKTPEKRADAIFGGKNTRELRKGIGTQPLNFEAHHVIPEQLIDEFDDFFKKINFEPQNGAMNGVMVPPDAAVLAEAAAKDKSVATEFGNSAFHKGSHPQYTDRMRAKLLQIKAQVAAGLDPAQAAAEVKTLVDNARSAIKSGGGKPLNEINF